jgi:hypothetical protein
MDDQYKSEISEIIETALNSSESLARGFPGWVRPVIRILIYFITLVFILAMLPITVLIHIVRKQKADAFSRLHDDLVTRWCSESSETALDMLRSIYLQLRQEKDQVMSIRGFKIPPFGKFHFSEYFQAVELLYHWELQHENWEEARTLCDEVLAPLLESGQTLNEETEVWIVYKARVICGMQGNTSAQQFLLRYVDTKREESPIRAYLYELRKSKFED